MTVSLLALAPTHFPFPLYDRHRHGRMGRLRDRGDQHPELAAKGDGTG